MSYNIAVKYLIKKYPTSFEYTHSFVDRLHKTRNKKEYEEMIANATDRDITQTVRNLDGMDVPYDDLLLCKLVHQYSASPIVIGKELTNHLIRMGINEV
jgi:hypothetical protein